MNSEASKEDARQRIANLVERFTRNERELLNPTYNENAGENRVHHRLSLKPWAGTFITVKVFLWHFEK